MGVKKEMSMSSTLDSMRLRFGRRTYFFDVKASEGNKKFLKITESQFFGEGKDRKYNSFVLFPENMQEFQKTLKQAIVNLGVK